MASIKKLAQFSTVVKTASLGMTSLNLNSIKARLIIKPLLVVLLVIVSAGAALSLPPAVELDRLMLHAKKALEAKSYNEAANQLAQAQKLGITLPENFALSYATALAGIGRVTDAKGVVDKYFSRYGTKGSSYKAVLELLVQIEDQEHGKSVPTIQSGAETEGGAKGGAADQEQPTTIGADITKQRAPARPQIPFAVSEDIWRVIEASEAYRNSPRPQTYKISYQTSGQLHYTGTISSTLPRPAATSNNVNTEAASLGDKCSMLRSSDSVNGRTTVTESYLCGGVISLGSTLDGKTSIFTKSIDELKGSLFPIRIGNQMSLRYQSAYVPDRRFDSSITSSYQVISQAPASELHPRLKGTAWKIRCQSNYTSNHDNKIISNESDDYYLEDLGVLLSAIGKFNFQEKKFFLPRPGDQTMIVAKGEYGSLNTTTYISYDWSVGSEDQRKSKIEPFAQAAPSAEASANWGLSDRDLSIVTGPELMKKVQMTERRADILKSAKAGNMVAQYLIGASYAYGIGVNKDDVQKVAWLELSAGQGLVRAITALAEARIRGAGTPQDDISGWTLLLQSSHSGNGIAQYLAAMFTLSGVDNGDGTTRQYNFLQGPDAVALLRKSAEAGVAPSQYALGHSYLEGTEYNDKDLKLARYWLQMAAAQHMPQAVEELAKLP